MNSLQMWVIYDHPSDLPEYFVARKWLVKSGILQATDKVLMDKNLEQLRAKLPIRLYCLPRRVNDDPVIIETWV